MNDLDRCLKRLFQTVKEPSTLATAYEDETAPGGFSTRVVARWQGARNSSDRPRQWFVLGYRGLVCAALVLAVTLALNVTVFRDEWSPALSVVEPVTQLVLAQ